MTAKNLGFFTRVLDDTTPAERYHLAIEQIVHAESAGFDSAWVAQHHFHANEGGLPSPLPFLAFVAARTSRIRLGTGVITLPMENAVRVAEDAAVIDLLSGGRLEVGLGSGSTPATFEAFGFPSTERNEVFGRHLKILLDAWRGLPLSHEANHLYPAAPQLIDRVWQATFSTAGGQRAGLAGDGLMLSRTQPRPREAPTTRLSELQNPIIDAYLSALPAGRPPRILASRTLFVADDRDEALHYAERGLRRASKLFIASGFPVPGNTLAELIQALDVHVGTAQDVLETLLADAVLARATDLVFQVHSIDPPHPLILRSIELIADQVAPALGWHGRAIQNNRHAAANVRTPSRGAVT
jgi:putative FMN-dependent luciferase-like monooxygenase